MSDPQRTNFIDIDEGNPKQGNPPQAETKTEDPFNPYFDPSLFPKLASILMKNNPKD